ncbi:MAG TPA: molybdenum cofactor guanylyltransferase [Polyangiaceae bacterium]|jgi:molybdopterin-guanine dinucleotide biosynthesis protein A
MSPPLIGIFVGGHGTRLGGVTKGLLRAAAGETLVARLLNVCREGCPHAELCLVGGSDAYRALGLRALDDDPPSTGPIGGLRALLRDARAHNADLALAIACDLPFLTASVVRRLAGPTSVAHAWVPLVNGYRQPLAAAYTPTPCLHALDALLAQNKRSLMSLLDALGPHVEELLLEPSDEASLRDWDTPEDIARG